MAELRFRMKRGVGAHYLPDGRRVLPGDEIVIDPNYLGSAKDKFDQISPDSAPPQPRVGLKLKALPGGWYDVINEKTGRKINDKALRKADADALVEGHGQQTDDTEQPSYQEEQEANRESHQEEG